MDGAATAGPFVAEAVAAARRDVPACPSGEWTSASARCSRTASRSLPGGLPVAEGGRVVAGLGVGGAAPELCHAIAAAVLVRVCVVGCGAIGACSPRSWPRSAEVWAYDVSATHVDGDQPRRPARGRRARRASHARTDAGEIPPCELGIVATKATPPTPRSPRPRTCSRRRRLQRAERDRQRGGDRAPRAARDPRRDAGGRPRRRARRRAVGRAGHDVDRAVRAAARPAGRDRRAGRRRPAPSRSTTPAAPSGPSCCSTPRPTRSPRSPA